jgi:enamine deaminase RidA (YjgF/YER057c/UK114 family)
MSQAVVHAGTAWLSGQVADDRGAGVEEQTRQVLAKIDALLAEVGSSRSRLISAQIWLSEIGTWSRMNEVWKEWIDPENPPARATVEARMAAPDIRVEIAVVAAV